MGMLLLVHRWYAYIEEETMSSIVDDALNEKNDPEPERYYDWMLWKMRQENKGKRVMTKEDIYKREIAEMQSTIHHLQMRVKELNDAILQLQKQRD